MADSTSIEWTEATWNPVTGCTEVSPGCDHCYAKTFAERFRGVPGHHFERGFDVVLRPERLDQPLRWKKPRRIFVNSMSDLFHDSVPDEYIARVFAVMHYAGRHTFQVLTKRHGRMRSLLNSAAFRQLVWDTAEDMDVDGVLCHGGPPADWPLPNVWLGVSVEDQKRADLRIPALLETPAAVRWLSCEPLLGPVDLHARDIGLHNWLPDFGSRYDDGSGLPVCQAHGISQCWQGCAFIDWVVVGGESGPGARPMHPDWARGLRDQCTAAGVPHFFKQWGEYGQLPKTLSDGRYANDPGVTVANNGTVYQPGDLAWPDGPRVGEAIRAGHDKANLHAMYRVGKKAAGRELDGRTWDEYPKAVA